MAGAALNINNSEVIKYTNELEKMHRSNLPLAIRGTLNDMAFDVKKNTLIKYYDKAFIVRAPSFIKRFSSVNKAGGFNIKTMHSIVGIKPGSNIAAKNLSKQETGGKVRKRDFIYKDEARVGGSRSKKVRKGNWLKSNEFVKGKPSKRRSRKSNYIAAAAVSESTGKFVNWEKSGQVFYVTNLSFSGKGRHRKAKIKSKEVATYEAGRTAALKARQFLKPASLETLKKTNVFYEKNAKRRFKKQFLN